MNNLSDISDLVLVNLSLKRRIVFTRPVGLGTTPPRPHHPALGQGAFILIISKLQPAMLHLKWLSHVLLEFLLIRSNSLEICGLFSIWSVH